MTKFLLVLPMCATIAPILSTTSCNKKTDTDPEVVEPTAEQKQKECAEGSDTCEFELTLKNEPDANHKVNVETKITSAYDSGVSISEKVEATVSGKTAKFSIKITHTAPNEATNIWAIFNITVGYYNQQTGKNDWTQNITGYKISFKEDTGEEHQLTPVSKLTNIEITCNQQKVGETDEFTLTIKNNRSEAIVDANLTIETDADQHINVDLIGNIDAGGEKQITLTKKQIKDEYFPSEIISSTAAFTFKVVRCGCYSVDADLFVYQYDYDNNLGSKLTATQIPEKQFLIKNTSGEYVLHTETLNQFLTSATEASYELTMLKGEFGDSTGQSTSSACNLKMTGVLDADGERVSKFIAFGDENPGYFEPILTYGNVSFDFNNMFIQGRDGKHGGDYFWQGMVCPGVNATNCYFSGALTIWHGESVFKNCTFDSTKTYKDAGSGTIKNNYPVWIYTNVQAEFQSCTFKSIGKAIKVCPDGDLGVTGKTFNVTVNDCDFNLEDPSSEFGTMAEYESPIAVDTNSMGDTNKYNIDITNCRVNDYWTQKKSGVTVNKLYWIKDKVATGTTTAKHITINGAAVVADEIVTSTKNQ